MLNRRNRKVLYDSIEQKIFIYNDENDEPIVGNVYFDYCNKEVRIYDLNKEKLTGEEKAEIIYAILEEQNHVPFIVELAGVEKDIGVEEYALLVNGYLTDGSYKEKGKKCKTLIEELIENCQNFRSSEFIRNILCNIDYLYKKYENKFEKGKVKILLTQNDMIKGFREYIIFTDLLSPYLKVKGKNCVVMTSNSLFKLKREVIIVPTSEYIQKYCKL